MNFAAITRWVVNFATSLHLVSLKALVRSSERKVAKAARNTDLANVIKQNAANVLARARKDHILARQAEKSARTAHTALVTAAVAEADSLRRDHTVGA